MNERIFELAAEAEDYADSIVDQGGEFHLTYTKKFAELIVRECIKEIEFQYGGGSDQPMDNEWDRAIECVSSMVKYRFGVEG